MKGRRRSGRIGKWLDRPLAKAGAGWLERLSLSSGADVMKLLVAQGEVSTQALAAFEEWSKHGATSPAKHVRDLEHRADDARHELVAALRTALATPISQEDLFVLSERCDRVVNDVKNIVGEAEALQWTPDRFALEMATNLREGMDAVLRGFSSLTRHSDETAGAAVDATHRVRGVEHIYRSAISELMSSQDLKVLFTCREMYRSYVRAAEALEALSDRLWYAVLTEP